MRRILAWIALAAIGTVATVALALAALALWWRADDALALARAPVPAYTLVEAGSDVVEKDGERRVYRDLRLESPGRPPVRFTLAVPEMAPAAPMPVLVIVGGLKSGRENLERLPPLGPNALVSFEYPFREIVRDKTRSVFARVEAAGRSARATAEQIAAVLRWAGGERWADPGRVSLLGYSLGAVVAPAARAKAKANGIASGVSILAFGGADIGALVPRLLKIRSPVLARPLAWLAGAYLNAVEPAHFLADLDGDKLFINAAEDELIPPESQRLMVALAPEPKWVVTIPGDHIDPRDPAVLSAVVEETRRWLLARGAADPP